MKLYAMLLSFGVGASAVAGTPDVKSNRSVVDPKLHAALFETEQFVRPWHIVKHADGSLEDGLDGEISEEDLKLTEKTASCRSSEGGVHEISSATAQLQKDGSVELRLYGRLPAHAGIVGVTLKRDGSYTVHYNSASKAPSGQVKWTVVKQEVRLKSLLSKVKAGARLKGWLSLEIEATGGKVGEQRTAKIRGYFKPFIQSVANQEK